MQAYNIFPIASRLLQRNVRAWSFKKEGAATSLTERWYFFIITIKHQCWSDVNWLQERHAEPVTKKEVFAFNNKNLTPYQNDPERDCDWDGCLTLFKNFNATWVEEGMSSH